MSAKSYRKYQRKYGVYLLLVLGLLHHGCIEEFQPETEFFESALVVESVITDEVRQQEVILARTFRFEETDPEPETNATVRVIDGEQTEYSFSEVEPGRYLSDLAFAAVPDLEYTLSVETVDGTRYSSDAGKMPAGSDFENLYAVDTTNRDGVEGLSLRVDSFDPSGNSRYYRFEYEETYKIIAPRWILQNAEVIGNSLVIGVKTKEERVCFNTEKSAPFILANTSALDEDRLAGFQVRFIARDDYFIAHRYSMLLRQYVLTREAHAYYAALSESSRSESLFSENQPGFIAGNITADGDTSKKVIGFFDISPVVSKRIFFDHEDFYPEDFPAAFPIDCTTFNQSFEGLISGIRTNNIKYILTEDMPEDPSVPYQVVLRPCGDCTALGDNVIPDFWEE